MSATANSSSRKKFSTWSIPELNGHEDQRVTPDVPLDMTDVENNQSTDHLIKK